MKIKSIKKIENADVYDITVDKYSNYVLENKIITHNSGLKYMSSIICQLSKRQDRNENKETVGNIITVKLKKSRFSKENSTCEVKLSYNKGLDRYHGLLEISEKYDIVKRIGNKYEFPDGSSHFRKEIESDPTKFWSDKTILDRINEAVKDKYAYKLEN